MTWEDILKWDKEWFASEKASQAHDLMSVFFDLLPDIPYRLIAARSELLGLKGWEDMYSSRKPKPRPDWVEHNIRKMAKLLDADKVRRKIPEEFHKQLDELINELNELAGR
jgi:hypothetical protein